MREIVRSLRIDLGLGLRRRPRQLDSSDWLMVAGFAVAAVLVGFVSDLFVFGVPSITKSLLLPPLLVCYPALIEEVVFRGVLLPRRLFVTSRRKRLAALAVSTTLFVAWHPLNHYLIGLSDTSLFIRPGFLIIVILLGGLCGHLYLKTQSLWPPIALHWATTVAWNLFLGRP